MPWPFRRSPTKTAFGRELHVRGKSEQQITSAEEVAEPNRIVLGEKIDPEDHFIAMHVPTWIERFNEGLDVADERLKQLAPDGLPIWQD